MGATANSGSENDNGKAMNHSGGEFNHQVQQLCDQL